MAWPGIGFASSMSPIFGKPRYGDGYGAEPVRPSGNGPGTAPCPLTPRGRIEILNDALARLLGLPEGGLLQRPPSALERRARLPEGMLSEAINDALDPEGASEGRPLRLRDEQGNPHWLVPAAALLQQPDGARTMVLFTEVTHFEMSKQGSGRHGAGSCPQPAQPEHPP